MKEFLLVFMLSVSIFTVSLSEENNSDKQLSADQVKALAVNYSIMINGYYQMLNGYECMLATYHEMYEYYKRMYEYHAGVWRFLGTGIGKEAEDYKILMDKTKQQIQELETRIEEIKKLITDLGN